MDKLAFNDAIFPVAFSTSEQMKMAGETQPLRCSRNTLRQLFKVNKMPRSLFKRENLWEGYSGAISRACPTFLCHV